MQFFCGNPKIPPPLRVVMPHFPPPLRRGIKGVGKIIKNSCHCEIYAPFCHCEALKKPKQSTNFCHCENLRFCKKADSWQSKPNPSLRILAIARRNNLFMIFADLFLDCHYFATQNLAMTNITPHSTFGRVIPVCF